MAASIASNRIVAKGCNGWIYNGIQAEVICGSHNTWVDLYSSAIKKEPPIVFRTEGPDSRQAMLDFFRQIVAELEREES